MTTNLHQTFLNNLNHLTRENESLLIAISGGQDSICLIKLIHDSITYTRDKIQYIYIDHQCKKDSKKQMQHLINYVEQREQKLSIYQVPYLPTSEVEARNIRYQLIIEHAIKHKCSIIITGHTETDKIETFLQKLIRGTSLNGSISLKTSRYITSNLRIIRPIITIKRIDTYWFCRKFLLPLWSDSTNYHLSINRNRLRHELIPYLQQFYKINIASQINQFIENCTVDNEYIKQSTTKLYLLIRHPKSIAINAILLNRQHLSLQIRMIKFFFS